MTAPFTAGTYTVTDEVKPSLVVSMERSLSLGYKGLHAGFLLSALLPLSNC